MRVLLAYDGSACAEAARDLVSRLPLPEGSVITMVTVLARRPELYGAPEFATVPADAAEAESVLAADLQGMLDEAAAPLKACRHRVETRVVRGRPATAILNEAAELRPDLIVVGSRGHGPLKTVLLGSVSTEVVDHAPCPVLVARTPAVRRAVLAMDGSYSSDRAVAVLRRWPILRGIPTRVVTVGPVDDAMHTASPLWPDRPLMHAPEVLLDRQRLVEVGRRAVDELKEVGIPATSDERAGDPATEIIAAAEATKADLIVVGSRGLSALPRLVLGSVARKVLLHAPHSVLVVRSARERIEQKEEVRAPAAMALGALGAC
ncbi:MAG TPA: universal stress protein [candidate division Zixibacteria bacterium]|nr:universal stress protein [candidate division Zixibacteria bacterium]